ncbi:MAG: carboxypeptidase regulatory-like domain-containing protein [Anaerolineae bacterium]|nr:carboxypeptidase regulatory-like domain-containing protein [Anaerolineae bacterium]
MNILRKFCFILILISLVSMIFLEGVLAQNPPPRPLPGGNSATHNGSEDDGDDDDDDSVIWGDIYGQVTDRSTGAPGAGLTVVINDIPIRTDFSGKFSLTGIADGTYNVDLDLPSDFVPAQTSQKVDIINHNKVEIELGYYSAYVENNVVDDTQAVDLDVTKVATNSAEEGQKLHSEVAVNPNILPETGGDFSGFYLNVNNRANLLIVIGCALCLLRLVPWRIS